MRVESFRFSALAAPKEVQAAATLWPLLGQFLSGVHTDPVSWRRNLDAQLAEIFAEERAPGGPIKRAVSFPDRFQIPGIPPMPIKIC